jgi:hypothetical protein
MFRDNVKERFEHARIYQGRLAELGFAAWLHNEGWQIKELEAHGGANDVVASDSEACSFAFEVKYFAGEETLFNLGVNALSGGGTSFGHVPVYSPVDYLVFRIFEAAKQLIDANHPRIVVAIIQDYNTYYAIPLNEHWIDWMAPRFLRRDSDIDKFLTKKYSRMPDLDAKLSQYIPQLDEIWFYDFSHGLMLRRRQIDRVRR